MHSLSALAGKLSRARTPLPLQTVRFRGGFYDGLALTFVCAFAPLILRADGVRLVYTLHALTGVAHLTSTGGAQ